MNSDCKRAAKGFKRIKSIEIKASGLFRIRIEEQIGKLREELEVLKEKVTKNCATEKQRNKYRRCKRKLWQKK